LFTGFVYRSPFCHTTRLHLFTCTLPHLRFVCRSGFILPFSACRSVLIRFYRLHLRFCGFYLLRCTTTCQVTVTVYRSTFTAAFTAVTFCVTVRYRVTLRFRSPRLFGSVAVTAVLPTALPFVRDLRFLLPFYVSTCVTCVTVIIRVTLFVLIRYRYCRYLLRSLYVTFVWITAHLPPLRVTALRITVTLVNVTYV